MAAPAQVRLSRGKDTRLAELASGERSLGLDWPTELPAPVVDGRTATYTIDDTTKLVVAVNRAGFEQHVVLSGPPSAPPSYTFPLRLKGLRLSKGPGGELLLHDAAGRLVSQSQAPRLWDARRDPRTDEPVKSAPLDVQIVDEPGRQELRISPPAGFLDQDTVYPVTLDPNPSLAILGDTWIQNTIANTSQYGSTELRSGTFDGGATVARSLLKFDTSGLSGTINSATFSLWNWYSYSCNARRTNIVALAGGFSSNTVWAISPVRSRPCTASATRPRATPDAPPAGSPSTCAPWSTGG